MTVSPKVTLRSACYNHQRFLSAALNSVLAQDYSDLQWVIIDDASPDGSGKLIAQWLETHQPALESRGIHVQFIQHQVNVGFVATLNETMELARGEYLCSLSCDDVMLPDRISGAVQLMDSLPDAYAAVFGDAYIINTHDERTGTYFSQFSSNGSNGSNDPLGSVPEGDIFRALLHRQFFATLGVMVRTEALRTCLPYDSAVGFEDYDMWLRLARNYRFKFDDQLRIEYRLHSDNLHKRIKDPDWRRYWILRKHLDHPAGRRAFVRNFVALWVSGNISEHILADARTLKMGRWSVASAMTRLVLRQPKWFLAAGVRRWRSTEHVS